MNETHWFAIKTRKDFQAAEQLAEVCDEVYFPIDHVKIPGHKPRKKALIPHVLFIRTTPRHALHLEQQGRREPGLSIPFWIYRYPKNDEIQIIDQKTIDLLRLLSSSETDGCVIYNSRDFRPTQRVRVIGGIYKGYEGYVKRIAKNRHVVVCIEGICMVALPFIHPDLLEPID